MARAIEAVANLHAPYQARDIFKPFHARTQRFAVGVTHRRAGKALDVSTPIPLADGSWKAMGELVAGDMVFDDLGKPALVLAAHPVQLGRPCYAVKFSDGAEIVCDKDHLWFTQTKLDSGSVKATSEIRDSLVYQGKLSHSITCPSHTSAPSPQKRYVTAVDPVESRPVRCITVDSPSHLYLAGENFVPTHNTVACVNDLLFRAATSGNPKYRMPPRQQYRASYIAPFRGQGKDVAWEYLKYYGRPLMGKNKPNESELYITLFNGARA